MLLSSLFGCTEREKKEMAADEAKPALCTAFQSGSIPVPPCWSTEATGFYRDLELWLQGQSNKDSAACGSCYGEKKKKKTLLPPSPQSEAAAADTELTGS